MPTHALTGALERPSAVARRDTAIADARDGHTRRPTRRRTRRNAPERAEKPVRREFREHARPKTVNTPEWSCRESNPGPLTPSQVFSERSLLDAFLSPGTCADTLPTGSVAVKVPQTPRDRESAASLLSEAGYWSGGLSRPTLHQSPQAARAKSVRLALALMVSKDR